MPAGYDAEVAELFRDLRAASNLTETDLAQRIATPIEVVKALEQGAIIAGRHFPNPVNMKTPPLRARRRVYWHLLRPSYHCLAGPISCDPPLTQAQCR